MPISKYFSGHGREVMAEMIKKHGEEGKRIFYATAQKRGQKPPSENKPPKESK